MLEKILDVYILLCPIDFKPRYVGLSQNAKIRYKEHLRDQSKTYKGYWIRKLLSKNMKPILRIIDTGLTKEKAKVLEMSLISKYRKIGYKLTNATDGGEGVKGRKVSTKEKALISKIHKGKVLSKETREKISKAKRGVPSGRKGTKLSEKSKQKLRDANIGKTISEDIRQKISKSLKGRPAWNKGKTYSCHKKGRIPWNTGKNCSGMSGKHHSTETKLKISNTKKGVSTMTDDGKRRLSEFRKSLAKQRRL